jgi:hypothetical protein
MTKPTLCVCDQHGYRPACASAQSDQGPCCSLSVSLLEIRLVSKNILVGFVMARLKYVNIMWFILYNIRLHPQWWIIFLKSYHLSLFCDHIVNRNHFVFLSFVMCWYTDMVRYMCFIESTSVLTSINNEPHHDKTNIMGLRPAWIQISLCIRAVWSGSMLFAYKPYNK